MQFRRACSKFIAQLEHMRSNHIVYIRHVHATAPTLYCITFIQFSKYKPSSSIFFFLLSSSKSLSLAKTGTGSLGMTPLKCGMRCKMDSLWYCLASRYSRCFSGVNCLKCSTSAAFFASWEGVEGLFFTGRDGELELLVAAACSVLSCPPASKDQDQLAQWKSRNYEQCAQVGNTWNIAFIAIKSGLNNGYRKSNLIPRPSYFVLVGSPRMVHSYFSVQKSTSVLVIIASTLKTGCCKCASTHHTLTSNQQQQTNPKTKCTQQ